MILFGQEASLIEIVGFMAGVAGVWLTMKESVWNFPVGLVNVIASLVLFYNTQLYSDTIQQAVYIVLLCYGWYKWSGKDGRWKMEVGSREWEVGSGVKLHITTSSAQLLTILFVIFVLCSAAAGFLFWKYTNASYPYWDAAGTTLSLIAQWMIAKKKIENWLLWIVVNILYVGIYYFKHLHLYMVLYALFLGMAVAGYYQWRKGLTPGPSPQGEGRAL